MKSDSHLDGNALGGALIELFGREMTAARACCAGCGSISHLGSLTVYDQAPGDVLRCPQCEAVVLVAAKRPTGLRYSFVGLQWVEVEDRE